jgi:hypothetical protein
MGMRDTYGYTHRGGSQRRVNYKDITKLKRTPGYTDLLVEEAIEIWLHHDNFKRGT